MSDFQISVLVYMAPTVKAKLAPNAWAVRIIAPTFIALEMPSTPIPKNPRLLIIIFKKLAHAAHTRQAEKGID